MPRVCVACGLDLSRYGVACHLSPRVHPDRSTTAGERRLGYVVLARTQPHSWHDPHARYLFEYSAAPPHCAYRSSPHTDLLVHPSSH